MSNNEIIQLDANFTKWKNSSGVGLRAVEPFLFYSVDNILKQYNLSFEDVRYGITDHPNDGGIDAFYILANRNTVVRDDLDLAASGTDRLRLILFQSKSSDSETGFKADDIDKFTKFVDDLLDLGKEASLFHYKYEGHLRTIMQTFKSKYLSIAGNFPKVDIDFYYVTKGDETKISTTEQDAVDRLEAMVKKHLGDSLAKLYPVNTQSLLKYAAKRRQKVRSLKWSEATPLPIGDGYIGLVKLKDWYDFLKDETGELDELIFESNVRGFRGNSAINRGIHASLQSSGIPFWQLNNGVTVVSSNKFQPIDSMNLNIEDPQVVNGLQTSRVIFEYFHPKSGKRYSAASGSDDRSLLVRVLKITNEEIRNDVIKATNSQNPMQPSALRGTDNIHRQIEDLYAKYGFYYDRRPGFYRDKGIPIEKIIGYTELVQAVICFLLHRPDEARARPSNYIALTKKGDENYTRIFAMDTRGNAKQPLGFYLKVVQIMRSVQSFLEDKSVQPGDLNNIKFYVAFYLCAEMTNKVNASAESVLQIDSDLIHETLEKNFQRVADVYDNLCKLNNDNRDAVAKGTEFLEELRTELSKKYPEDQSLIPPKKRKIRDVLKAGQVT